MRPGGSARQRDGRRRPGNGNAVEQRKHSVPVPKKCGHAGWIHGRSAGHLDLERVAVPSVLQKFIVKMRARRQPRRADSPDDLPGSNRGLYKLRLADAPDRVRGRATVTD